jgi:hypothetical protein
MRRAIAVAALLSILAAAPSAVAALPRAGTLVPGRSLGGVRLGEPAGAVRAALGRFYGVCRGCARSTWYFTYGRFDQHGLAVELARGRVSALYTLWQPAGWKRDDGLALGADSAEVTRGVAMLSIECGDYSVLARDAKGVRTAYYVVGSQLWGFGLMAAGADPCR